MTYLLAYPVIAITLGIVAGAFGWVLVRRLWAAFLSATIAVLATVYVLIGFASGLMRESPDPDVMLLFLATTWPCAMVGAWLACRGLRYLGE